MPARRLDEDPTLDGASHLGEWSEWVRPSGAERTPGAWAARLRFILEERVVTRARFEAQGGYELFLDGEAIGRSASGLVPGDASHENYELDLGPGRHELFATIWSTVRNQVPPAFGFVSERLRERFTTGAAQWVAAPLRNVAITHPWLARVLVSGEPAGPGGMDRGAEWTPVRPDPDFGPGSWYGPVLVEPIAPAEIEDLSVDEGDGTAEGFRSVLGREGLFAVAPHERSLATLVIPDRNVLVRLRASGGEGSLIRVGSGEDIANTDVYLPHGFRQDFASFAAFDGNDLTITIEGGERGTALFRLELFEEIEL